MCSYCNGELVLAVCFSAGAKIGHRSLMRYYKQRFGNQRAVALTHNRNAVGRVLRQYRALGWGGEGGKIRKSLGSERSTGFSHDWNFSD